MLPEGYALALPEDFQLVPGDSSALAADYSLPAVDSAAMAVDAIAGQHAQGDAAGGANSKDGAANAFDQWDWKTDAPEFVPGGMKPVMVASEAIPQGYSLCMGGGKGGGATGASTDGAQLPQLQAQFEWQLRSKSEEVREMQSRMNQLEIETAQVRASWDVERRALQRQVGQYRGVLERYCIPIEEVSSSVLDSVDEGHWGEPASAETHWLDDSAAAGDHMGAAAGGTTVEVTQVSSSLDSKMRQLNSLLQEGASGRRKGAQDADAGAEASSRDAIIAREAEGPDDADKGNSSGTIANTLKQMFPHANIRTSKLISDEVDVGEGAAQEVKGIEQMLRRLERQTGSQVDERAMKALTSLSARDAREGLGKVDELVASQGGTCRNLSSILQSVCRKIEKRSSKGARPEDDGFKWGSLQSVQERRHNGDWGAQAAGDAKPSQSALDALRAGRARKADEEGDAFAATSSDSERGGKDIRKNIVPRALENGPLMRMGSMTSQCSSAPLDTPAGKRSNRSWADMGSGDEEDLEGLDEYDVTASPREDEAAIADEYWTSQRIELAAKQGFELLQQGEWWELKITMASLDPPLSEVGMERYCQWLGGRLASLREEHGAECLRHCRSEVDFSHNNMSNQMVWMLLEKLAQSEVHVAILKLFGNLISTGGVLAICEFIRKNELAEPVWELHLSHNEIDDDSALELLRTLHSQRPRYPAHRLQEGSKEEKLTPVWLRLNHNRIREPDQVRKVAELEGVSICIASDRQVCGPVKCCKSPTPLVHLFSFNMQARRKSEGPATSSPEKALDDGQTHAALDKILGCASKRTAGAAKDEKAGAGLDAATGKCEPSAGANEAVVPDEGADRQENADADAKGRTPAKAAGGWQQDDSGTWKKRVGKRGWKEKKEVDNVE